MGAVRNTKLDLRLSAQAKATLHAAARAQHRSLSQFVLESALARADEALADRRRFELDDGAWEAFQAALDAPMGPAPRMRRLLEKRAPTSVE